MRDEVKLETIVTDLATAFASAWKTVSDLESAEMTNSYDQGSYEESLAEEILAIYVRLRFALEVFGVTSLLAEFVAGFEPLKKNATEMYHTSYGEAYPPALNYLERYFLPLKGTVKKREAFDVEERMTQLHRILLGTPKIVKDRKVKPKNEKEVRQCLYEILLHVYPDTVREIPIAKVTKCYKPDLGVPSLKVAIEYKFVNSEKELKTSVGGIYEDVHGYAGSEDWKVFYAVLYMTDAYATQAQIDAEFKMSNVSLSWKPILVTGQGGRIQRSRVGSS